MIISAAIVSQSGQVYHSKNQPLEVKADLGKHAREFLRSLSHLDDDDIELPYIETKDLRYIYKQTEDLYWLLVTKIESNMFSDIKLMGKFVCTILEYGSSVTNSHTITDEQKEIFYRHIWFPWDSESQCFLCGRHDLSPGMWEREFEDRINFLISIRDGNVDDRDASYFAALVNEAWEVRSNLFSKVTSMYSSSPCHSDTLSIASEEEESNPEWISEETLVDKCRLKCRLEDIWLAVTRFQDPYLRLFARRDLLEDSSLNSSHLCSAPAMDMDSSL